MAPSGQGRDEEGQVLRQRLPFYRFPELANLRTDELPSMSMSTSAQWGQDPVDAFRSTVLKPRRGRNCMPVDEGSGAAAARRPAHPRERAPFRPANPYQARKDVSRKPAESFISLESPYLLEHEQYVHDVVHDTRKSMGPFHPSSAAQARESIRLDVYLTSADETTKLAERIATRQRAAKNMRDFLSTTGRVTGRGHAKAAGEEGHVAPASKVPVG